MATGDRLAGVIGGMGPEATIDFMSRVMACTPAITDQDHIRMLVDHNPRIPSRQQAMRGEGQDPGPVLASIAAGLQAGGADFIVMPCNLAHAWASDIEAAITIPFISIVNESVACCAADRRRWRDRIADDAGLLCRRPVPGSARRSRTRLAVGR